LQKREDLLLSLQLELPRGEIYFPFAYYSTWSEGVQRFYLGLKRDKLQKSIYPLEGSLSIGRSAENDITLVDWEVSRTHARVTFQKGAWIVEDLGSANGIIFAGKRVTAKDLKSGDRFHIGGAEFIFMEESGLEDTRKTSDTIEIFASLIKYQTPLLDSSRQNSGFMRLQGALLSTPIFGSLAKKELRDLEDITNLHFFNTGQLIFREGDPGRSIYLILDGQVKVFTKDYQGEEFQLATLGSNHFFGEMAFLTGKPRSSSVATVQESLLGEISYNNMRRLMMRYPQVKLVLVKYYKERVEDSRKKRAQANIKERRQQPRLKERLLVTFGVWPMENLPAEMINHTYKATSSDISLSGMMLEVMGPAMEAFRAGFRLQLEIQLPSRFGVVETEATVRHVTRDKNIVRLGLDFADTEEEDKKKLQDFIYGQTHNIE
jgi:CRP-like cAMP-binding protein